MQQTTYRSAEETLGIYLPATLVDHWAERPQQPPSWGHWLHGSLMFCDISGFTSMSENLARFGKEGAELMAAVLNQFFERMVGIADEWGGVQMKFGGDAMLLLFSEQEHAERAAAAGLEMQAAMVQFRRVQIRGDAYPLRMRVAIHSGRFFGASVGQPQGILHYLLLGADVNRTAEIEGLGKPGQVIASAHAAAAMGSGRSLSAAGDGVWRVRSLNTPARPARRVPSPVPGDVLKRYLLPPLAAPLLEGRLPSFSGEHRRVTAVFINLLGATPMLQTKGDAEALSQIDAYVRMLIAALLRHGGFLVGSDLAHEGDKLICLFGAPVSLEKEEDAALRAMIDLDCELASSGLDLRHRIGISSGSVFAGEIGSSLRREYTVIGDSVNLAARLMTSAKPGEIIASAPTMERAGTGFHVQRLKPLQVKGKAAPVLAMRVRGTAPEPVRQAIEPTAPIFGREGELETLVHLSRQVSARRSGWAYIHGEPGIGKSRLTAELSARLLGEGWGELTASSQMHTRNTPFSAWREPLRRAAGISSGLEPDAAWKKLRSAVEVADPELAPFVSVLSEVIGLPLVGDLDVSFLEPKERRRYLTSIAVELLHNATGDYPQLLLFEDAHWADAPSLELLAAVLSRQDSRLLVVVTSREARPPERLGALAAPTAIHLRELPREAARGLAASVSGLQDADIDKIVARAQGNPLFLHEISRIGVVSAESLPETVNDMILVRLDRLQPEEKAVLRLASVIGPAFRLEALHALVGESLSSLALERVLEELKAQGFTREEGRDLGSYSFAHILTRDVAYETLPFAQRRTLHRQFAQHVEQGNATPESDCELLLHHFELAGDPPKVARYAAMSGDRAAAVFAIKEAVDYYRRSLTAITDFGKPLPSDRSFLIERLGDCFETGGQHGEAAKTFSEALAQWKAAPRRPRFIAANSGLREREAALCRKVAVSFERSSDYDESLSRLDEAFTALPSRAGRVRAQIYASKSLALFRKGQYEEAIHWGRLGLDVTRRNADRRQLAYAHHILAGSYMEVGKLNKALQHDRLAVRFYHEVGDLAGQARANSNLGLSYQMVGILDAALYHYEVGLKADERIGNVSHAAIVHNNIGEVLMMLGRVDEAMPHLENVVNAYRSDPGLMAVAGLAEVNLSRCWLRKGVEAGAKLHLRRGLRRLQQVGAQGLLMEALLQHAELRLAAGRPREARGTCRDVLRIAQDLATTLVEARAERLLGRAEAALGNRDQALSHLQTSETLTRQAGASYEEALTLIESARVLQASPLTSSRATTPLKRSIAILARMGAASDLAEAQRLLDGRLAGVQP